MSAASDLRTTLAPTGLPVAQNDYTGTEAAYITFNFSTVPDLYGDNVPGYERYLIQVHLIAPATQNTTALESQIKTLLAAADYTYPDTTEASDDESERHVVFETETAVYVGG